MNESAIVIIVVVAALCAFTIIWLAVVYLASRAGGWSSLAHHYASHGDFPRPRYSMQSARIGLLGKYGTCLTFAANEDGLYAQTETLFKTGHQTIMIPWADIEMRESSLALRGKQITFSPRRAPDSTIMISRDLAERLCNDAGKELPQNG